MDGAMRKKQLIYILFISFLLIFPAGISLAQTHPPEPMSSTNELASPCDPDGGGLENEDGTPITPPPGLCMPINDYIYPLLVLGVIYGIYKTRAISFRT